MLSALKKAGVGPGLLKPYILCYIFALNIYMMRIEHTDFFFYLTLSDSWISKNESLSNEKSDFNHYYKRGFLLLFVIIFSTKQ